MNLTPLIIILVLAFLAASASVLAGALAGAWIAYRLHKGLPPIPERPRRVTVEPPRKEEKPKIERPEIRA